MLQNRQCLPSFLCLKLLNHSLNLSLHATLVGLEEAILHNGGKTKGRPWEGSKRRLFIAPGGVLTAAVQSSPQ